MAVVFVSFRLPPYTQPSTLLTFPRKKTVRSDLELLEAWGSGELLAGSELFERYLDRLYRFFRNKVTDDVSDLVQQTLLACVEGRRRIREGASFRAYLFQTARHNLYAYYRLRQRDAVMEMMRTSVGARENSEGSPSRMVGRMQDERRLIDALQRVPLESQVLLELVYREELSSAEVAEVFGITAAAVRGRVARAVAQLRDHLVGHSADGGRQIEPGLSTWARRILDEIDVIGSPSAPSP